VIRPNALDVMYVFGIWSAARGAVTVGADLRPDRRQHASGLVRDGADQRRVRGLRGGHECLNEPKHRHRDDELVLRSGRVSGMGPPCAQASWEARMTAEARRGDHVVTWCNLYKVFMVSV